MPHGDVCLIDREDLLLFAKHSWYTIQGGGRTKYLVRNGNNRTISFHTQLIKAPKSLEIDHINRNGLDNRKSNLRIVTHQQNIWNTPIKKHSSKYKYVYWCKIRVAWVSMVHFAGKTKNLGRFDSEVSAAVAANNYIISNNMGKQLNNI